MSPLNKDSADDAKADEIKTLNWIMIYYTGVITCDFIFRIFFM